MAIDRNKLKRWNLEVTKQSTKILPDVLVVIFCLTSLVLSIVESRLNSDAHDWGLMYANAADLHNGLIPYKQIFIQYGFLTTLIQSWSLTIFGDKVVSVGIITGLFYSLSIYLSYCLWQKILDKWLASLSAILMFLVDGYITFPWSNYFYYTFLLIALLLLTSSLKKINKYLLAGIFMGLSFLARQSPLPIIIPIYLYFGLLYFSSKKELRKIHVKNFLILNTGFGSVMTIFLFYIFRESALTDWIAQSFTITKFYVNNGGGIISIIIRFLIDLMQGFIRRLSGLGLRMYLYSLIFLNSLVVWRIVFFKVNKNQVTEKTALLFLFSSIVLLGYVNSLHGYFLFRLQNSSSLGFGLLIFSFDYFTRKSWKRKIFIFAIPISLLIIYLSLSFGFRQTSYIPFKSDQEWLSSSQRKAPENIPMLESKLFGLEERLYYQTLTETINNYSCHLEYLVNFSMNSYIPHLSMQFKNVQRSPFYLEEFSTLIFQDEQPKITELLKTNKALLIASSTTQIPRNYKVILQLTVPINIPYIGNITYVAVPQILSDSCQSKHNTIKNF